MLFRSQIQCVPKLHEHIRFQGEDICKDQLLLSRGTLLQPMHLALLAAVGRVYVKVYPAPQVVIGVTGSELIKGGEEIKPGKIYDSNSVLLRTLVEQCGGTSFVAEHVADDPESIRRIVEAGLKKDMLIISGGVSVGSYDFVRAVLLEEGVAEIFWKVDIKPGKPIFFGKKGKTLIFGLPGNPVSVFVTFEEFVKPVLLKMQMKTESKDHWIEGELTHDFENGNRPHFVRVFCEEGTNGYSITPLEKQGSHMLGALASSNAILRMEAGQKLKAGDSVRVKLI